MTKTETWLGHQIRFVEITTGKWGAVAADACAALDIKRTDRAVSGLRKDGTHSMSIIDRLGRAQTVNVIDERNIYLLIFKSRKPQAVAFQDWVCEMLETLRAASGLAGFEVFRMLDKEHQREAMKRLRDSLSNPVRVDFIRANTIVNKAVSTRYGHDKMLKKSEMTPDMLVERQPILDDTVTLMSTVERFNLPVSVSKAVYDKYAPTA